VMKNRYCWMTIGVILVASLLGCQGERKETPTKGNITVVVSESVAPVILLEKQQFEELYPEAHIDLVVASAREAITRMFNDTIKVIVSSRPLNAEERNVAKRANFTLGEFKIAFDGVAIIVDTLNLITQLRTTQLDSIFSGKITNWNSLNVKKNAPIELCVPDRNAGTFEVFATKILHGGALATPAKVAVTSQEMIEYVSTHPNAIGLLGMNWLNKYEGRIKALSIADPNAPDSLGTKGEYFSPHPAYVYQQSYPLTHDVFIYSHTDGYSVGNGFLTFIASGPGQKIILKNGLVPATMPVRLVQLTNRGQ
jgi:phosphate transport system substrate-binding protein